MAVHEEEPGEGWGLGQRRMRGEAQPCPDEGAVNVLVVGSQPSEDPERGCGFVVAQPQVCPDEAGEPPLHPVDVLGVVVA